MAKYKYILTIIITLCTITTFAQPAQYTPMTAAGYQMKRLKVDSTLHLPSFCGTPTIRGSVAKEGALAIDTCGGFLYMWTRAAGWDTVNTSGGSGGSSTDTTSLSNRINKKIDSLRRSRDSVYAFINGTKVFQFKDSVGSGGGSSDTIFTLNPIMFIRRNDSNIVFFNADTANAWRGTGGTPIDTTNQFVKRLTRLPGVDSIIYFVGANRFAIKDSIGVAGTGTQNFVSKWSNTTTLENSQIFDSVNVGINTTTPAYKLDVNGEINTNQGIRIGNNNAKTGFYGGSNIIDFFAGNNKLSTWGLAPVGGSYFDNFPTFTYNTGDVGITNIIKIRGNAVSNSSNNAGVTQLDISPTYTQQTFGTGILRGIYYNPSLGSGGINTSKHIAFESASGNVVMKGLKKSSSTTDSIAIWINDTLSKAPYPSGGISSSDTIYTQNPIMFITRNDSNIVFFNADTANAWRNTTSGIDSLKRSSDSVFARKNGNFIFQFKDSVGTNPAPVGYYGAFQDTTTQTAALINTAYGVKLGVTDLSNGVTVSNNTIIKIANAGIYNIQFSLQLEKTGGSGNMIADIWLRKNGVNLQGTTGKVVLTGSANASPIVAAWNYLVAVSSNDSLELMWATSNDNVVIKASPATSPFPSIPSAILTVTQQSGIMAGTGISPLDTANMLLPYLRKTDTTALQRKSIPSYTFLANNTPATADAQALPFKDTSGTYTGTITWNGTAPTSGTFSYRWTRIGKMVTMNISLIYTNAGTSNSTLVVTLPADAPNPTKPAGLTSASNLLYPCFGTVNGTGSSTLSNSAFRGSLRNNAANNGFEFFINYTLTTPINANFTCTYFTD